MKNTVHTLNLIVTGIIFLLQITVSSANGQGTIKKTEDNCDKIKLKTGKTLSVDITRIDSSKIYYVQCDSLEPEFTVLKKTVQSVKYANDITTYENDDTYGKNNTNSFGWANYADQLKKQSEKENKDLSASKEKYNSSMDDRPVSRTQLRRMYQSCPEARKELNKAKPFNIAGLVLVAGGSAYYLLSNMNVSKQQEDDYNSWWDALPPNDTTSRYDHHKWVVKKETNAIIGLGVTAVGAVLIAIGTNHYIHSIKIYNEKHRSTGYIPVQYDLMVNSNGLGVRMRF